MLRMRKIASIALWGIGFLTATILPGCGSGTSVPPPVISISFAGGTSQTITQGQSTTITVNVSNDSSGKGVTWKLSGPGALSKQTNTSVEYDAPGSVTSNATATVTATSVADATKSAAFTVTITPPPPISVSVSPGSVNMQAGSTQTFTAVISNDPGNKGVTWTISPATGAGTLNNLTSTSVTYNAPASPPASDVAVTITATSVTDTTKSGTASVIVPAITVSITPGGTTVQAGSIVALTAAVGYDPGNSGVTWSISPATGAGTLSNATNTSVTYNAPAPPPPASDVAVTITATSVADPSKSSTASITVAAISVSVVPPSANVPAGSTQAFTATVNFDPSNSGVNWALSAAAGAGTLSDATITSVAYHAPADAPASNLTVTITATSLADSSKSSSATITVPAISVGVSPPSALMPINATQQFTATVNFDPKVQGATWTSMQGGVSCGAACGTFAPASTASGAPTTYTAPAAVPATSAVAITATSVTDTTKSAAATIKLTNGIVKLVPASLNFSRVKHNRTKSLSLSLTNTGKTALSISGMSATTHFSQTNNCGVSVGAGIVCTITVKFSPGATGSFGGTLTISDSSPDSPQTVALSGTGTAFFSPASMNSALATEITAAAPSPTGPSDVGTRVVDLVDRTREESFLGNGSKRELLVRFWYPAALKQDCQPAEYTTPAVWSYFSQLVGVPLPDVRTNSCQDANIANGAHPVVVFTPGYTGTFTDYTFLFEDLASRGYVVASLDHPNEATAVEFPDGRFVKSLFGSHLGTRLRTDEDAYTSAVTARLNDLKFILSELVRLNAAPNGPFAGRLDMSRVALAGHSLGGLTALLGVEQEPQFKAGIILDGVAPDRLVNATETPMLVLITGRQQWSVDECRLWSNLRGPRLGVNLPGAEHLAPSDAVWLAKGLVKTGRMSPEKTISVLRNYIAAFLDANLRGQPMDSLLTGPSADFPDVVITTQSESACGEKE